MKEKLRHFLLLNLGLFVVALGVVYFKSPNNFAFGGVSGIGIIIAHYAPGLNLGITMFAINMLFELLALLFLGKEFALKTLYSSVALSAFVWVCSAVYPMSAPFTDDTLLELIFAIILPATGSAIVFNLNSSTGGTDILAKIVSKFTSIEIGKALFVSDVLIVVTGALIFGIRTGLYCVLGLILKGSLVDVVIDGLKVRKEITIISDREEEIVAFIMNQLHRGATVHLAYGAYSHKEERVITTVLNRRQAMLLRNYIKTIDAHAFITITNSCEIIGKGFSSL